MAEFMILEGHSVIGSINKLDIRLRVLANKYFKERDTRKRIKLYKKLCRLAKQLGYKSNCKFAELKSYRLF